MNKKIEYEKGTDDIYFIDGFTFKKPDCFGGWFFLGVISLFMLITFPVWLPIYLIGRFVILIAGKKQISKRIYFCPICNEKIENIGDLLRVKCKECGWNTYLDFIEDHKERGTK